MKMTLSSLRQNVRCELKKQTSNCLHSNVVIQYFVSLILRRRETQPILKCFMSLDLFTSTSKATNQTQHFDSTSDLFSLVSREIGREIENLLEDVQIVACELPHFTLICGFHVLIILDERPRAVDIQLPTDCSDIKIYKTSSHYLNNEGCCEKVKQQFTCSTAPTLLIQCSTVIALV